MALPRNSFRSIYFPLPHESSKNGERRFQYPDGSLTPLGREHYGVGPPRGSGSNQNENNSTMPLSDKEFKKLTKNVFKERYPSSAYGRKKDLAALGNEVFKRTEAQNKETVEEFRSLDKSFTKSFKDYHNNPEKYQAETALALAIHNGKDLDCESVAMSIFGYAIDDQDSGESAVYYAKSKGIEDIATKQAKRMDELDTKFNEAMRKNASSMLGSHGEEKAHNGNSLLSLARQYGTLRENVSSNNKSWAARSLGFDRLSDAPVRKISNDTVKQTQRISKILGLDNPRISWSLQEAAEILGYSDRNITTLSDKELENLRTIAFARSMGDLERSYR